MAGQPFFACLDYLPGDERGKPSRMFLEVVDRVLVSLPWRKRP